MALAAVATAAIFAGAARADRVSLNASLTIEPVDAPPVTPDRIPAPDPLRMGVLVTCGAISPTGWDFGVPAGHVAGEPARTDKPPTPARHVPALPELTPMISLCVQAMADLEGELHNGTQARGLSRWRPEPELSGPGVSVPFPPAMWSGLACLGALAGFKLLRRRSLNWTE